MATATAPPLAYDASSSGFAHANKGTQVASQASPSFSPPAGSVLIVNVFAIGNNSNSLWSPPMTVTDSLVTPLTYTVGPAWDGPVTNGFATGCFTAWAAVGATAPGSMTVTATISTTAAFSVDYMAVQVAVWDNASTSNPFGAHTANWQVNEQNLSVPVTPTALGSAICLVVADGEVAGAVTAGPSSYVVATDSGILGAFIWLGTSGGPTLTPSLTTVNVAATMTSASSIPGWVAYEVLAI